MNKLYTAFRNFTAVIQKAEEECANSGQQVSEHLVEVNEVFIAGRGKKKNSKLQTKPLYLKQVGDHPVDFNEMVVIGSGVKRNMPSYKLSRYA